ncbi:MAG: STAS domain-containing protein [Thiomicrospira sp.]|uniref:STAS domain-containing protein n=1 Tax=Thiomicrospira sp. TaxID=935 RepID=UPI0019E8528B|nr:STAS domain-containing protein [Thiomicrospira sp.]MBE0493604.1 STAS domain-containing protein [Thiomicrospira sp.]
MSVEGQLVGNTAILFVKGRFDIASYEEFNQAYINFIGRAEQFQVDLSTTTFMDSSALGMLLLLREKAGDSVHIELINADDEVSKILQIAQFQQLFTIR